MAESCNKYLSKGRPVYVEGRLRIEEWTNKDGIKQFTAEVNANEVHFLGGNEGNGNNKQDIQDHEHHNQRRKGEDENERSQEEDSLALPKDEIPF